MTFILAWFFVCFVKFAISSFSTDAESSDHSASSPYACEYYMADSKVPGFGRGVFAGRDLVENEVMFDSTTVLIRNEVAMQTMLAYYVFTDENEEYEISMFGPMLMLNHANNETVDYIFTEEQVASPRHTLHAPYSTHTDFQVRSIKNASIGSELFTFYGKRWFKDRRITPSKMTTNTTSISYTPEELEQVGHCMTDVFVTDSDIPYAGKGVFSSRSFQKGEIVSISPVLVLPRHAFEGEESDHSVLLNYLITSEDFFDSYSPDIDAVNKSDVALLPLTQAGMMNHGAGDMVNVEIDWFQWSADEEESRLDSWSAAKLEEAQFAPLDLQYVATRDIAAGEELLMDYGPEWEDAWKSYLDEMIHWHEVLNLIESLGKNLDSFDMIPPQFRASVGSPPGLFPSSFFVDDCLGVIPCTPSSGENVNVNGRGSRLREKHSAEEMATLLKAREHAATYYSNWLSSDEYVNEKNVEKPRMDEPVSHNSMTEGEL
mmetsp:Transcript_1983/g.3782  ORF Transcript_1983/g.3782 Transcript_1983/m.3782 type:complete len:488 (-) Transcript_1983:111-1574(-)